MLTSLLSLYIASSIKPNLSNDEIENIYPEQTFVSVASFDFGKLFNAELQPIKNPQFIEPIIGASSSIGLDMETGTILFEKNPHERRPIASITKLMTILIILEETKSSDIATITRTAAATEGSTMNLVTDEQITVENLMYGAVIQSANDAAIALAEHNAGSVSAFVEKMNNKATKLGLINTHFANPTGLDHPDNYSSAYDVSKLAQYIYNNKFIQNTAIIKDKEVSSIDGRYKHHLKSTNELLDSYLNIKGLKTGRTTLAGLCLVGIAENDTNNEIVTVVLNSPDRFQETKILVDWLFRAYTWPTNN